MTACDYQILQYTNSELQAHGVPFILILRLHLKTSSALAGYVLQDWEAKIQVRAGYEIDDVAGFLEDVGRHSRASRSSDSRFFDGLDDLSVGPIRQLVSGSCLVQELGSIIPTFFDGQVEPSDWQRSFEVIGDDFFARDPSAAGFHQSPTTNDQTAGTDPSTHTLERH
jgi:hypothetical protein